MFPTISQDDRGKTSKAGKSWSTKNLILGMQPPRHQYEAQTLWELSSQYHSKGGGLQYPEAAREGGRSRHID